MMKSELDDIDDHFKMRMDHLAKMINVSQDIFLNTSLSGVSYQGLHFNRAAEEEEARNESQ